MSIVQSLETYIKSKNFNAPYGVLIGREVNKKGVKYLTITFGRARTLDATVEVYNKNFMILRTSRHGRQRFDNLTNLQEFLDTL